MAEELDSNLQENKGNITCDRNILISIISLATKEISGVSKLQNNFLMKVKSWFNKSESKGVKIKFDKNGKLTVDIYIRILSGNNVPEIAFKVQNNVKNNIVSMVDMRVEKINVHIIGVDFKGE